MTVGLECLDGRLGQAVWQEEALQVGRTATTLRIEEGARFRDVRREQALACCLVLGLDGRELLGRRAIERERHRDLVAEKGAEMVLQVPADSGQIRGDIQAQGAEVIAGTDTGEHQEMGGVDGPPAQDHFA